MLNRLDLRGRGTDVVDHLPRPTLDGDEPIGVVRELIARASERG
ncbi:MAG: hypothetical protein R2710_19380 [Acidimicrobiales bacterium]